MELIKTSECQNGQILSEDLFIDSTIHYKAGTVIIPSLIADLRDQGVHQIKVEQDSLSYKYNGNHQDPSTPGDPSFVQEFFNNLFPNVIHELRYGRSCHDYETCLWIESLYTHLMSNTTVYYFMKNLEQWDTYSYYHSIDVFILSALLARDQGVKDIETFALGCLLHDIGKLYIPKWVLNKKGKLTQQEYNIVKRHTLFGADLLEVAGFPERVVKIAQSHHERLDGNGYPNQVFGEALDGDVRIIMIVDVYSALTLDRTYRDPVIATEALEIILNDESQYDIELCFAFIKMLELYPAYTKVILSDGREGSIVYEKEASIKAPLVKLRDRNALYQLPIDLSTKVETVVDWKNNSVKRQSKKNWYDYLYNLTEGKKVAALQLLDTLSDGKRIEDIYIDIIERSMIDIQDAIRAGKLSPVDNQLAMLTTIELLNFKMLENTFSFPQTAGLIAIANLEGITNRMPLKMIDDLLSVNGWRTFYLGDIVDRDMITQIIKKREIEHIVLSLTKEENVDILRDTIIWLKKEKPSLVIMINGPMSYLLTNFDRNIITSHGLKEFLSGLH